MRILLAMMLLSPFVIHIAVSSGAQSVTPILVAMALIAIVAQVAIERRARKAA
ncbi:MAG: hypothetical protein AAFR73_07150 [Pseudomonadota bacterium]